MTDRGYTLHGRPLEIVHSERTGLWRVESPEGYAVFQAADRVTCGIWLDGYRNGEADAEAFREAEPNAEAGRTEPDGTM